MPSTLRVRSVVRRAACVIVLLAIVAAVWFVIYGGRFLQHEDPLAHADAMFVLAGARVERWMEAVDLYRAGYSRVIVLSAGYPEPIEMQLRQRGITFITDPERSRGAMLQLGVRPADILTPDVYVDNTAQEAALVRRLAAQYGWHRVMIVTSKYHTRRAGFAFRRALKGSGIQVMIRATRYDMSDPARWWHLRPDSRKVTLEWQKLIAYWCGLGE
jgi:uncharacterized SAM-binding protein YcdF (DUF218 family)